MKKGIIFTILILLILVIGFFSLGLIYREYQISKYSFSSYYKNLARKCSFKDSVVESLFAFDCCLDSVKEMVEKNYKPMIGVDCPEGYRGLGVGCPGAYSYCVPSKDMGSWILPFQERIDNASD